MQAWARANQRTMSKAKLRGGGRELLCVFLLKHFLKGLSGKLRADSAFNCVTIQVTGTSRERSWLFPGRLARLDDWAISFKTRKCETFNLDRRHLQWPQTTKRYGSQQRG